MLIDFTRLTPDQAYFALIQAVIPRPIAWVLTGNGDGSHNLAPFSFFTGVCGDPPLIVMSIGHKADGSRKDTWVNIDQRSDFIVHILPPQMAAPMVHSAASLPFGESEVTATGVTLTQVPGWPLPRIVGPKLAMHCTRHAIHQIGNEGQGVIYGRIEAMHVDDDAGSVINGRILIDPAKVNPLSRLGGSEYAVMGDVVTHKRPQ